jgi:hypothetical protein
LLCTDAASCLLDTSTVSDHLDHYRCILMVVLITATSEAGRDVPEHGANQPGRGELRRAGPRGNLRDDGFDGG